MRFGGASESESENSVGDHSVSDSVSSEFSLVKLLAKLVFLFLHRRTHRAISFFDFKVDCFKLFMMPSLMDGIESDTKTLGDLTWPSFFGPLDEMTADEIDICNVSSKHVHAKW